MGKWKKEIRHIIKLPGEKLIKKLKSCMVSMDKCTELQTMKFNLVKILEDKGKR